jgi:hypothetical protein
VTATEEHDSAKRAFSAEGTYRLTGDEIVLTATSFNENGVRETVNPGDDEADLTVTIACSGSTMSLGLIELDFGDDVKFRRK